MITLKKINKKYQETVIKNFTHSFKNRGVFAILGDSGSGKSTLLNIISGVDKAYSGEVRLDDIDIKLLNESDSALYRLNNIGYVFQDFRLLNLLSVFDNVLFNLDAMSTLSKPLKEKMVNEALQFVGLENKKKVAVNKLSGGEKQRVAFARAIVSSPKYLLCDEPTGNLDDKNAIMIFELIKKYSENHGVILVTHDENKIRQYADEIIYLKDGEINHKEIIHQIDDDRIPRIKIAKKDSTSLSFALRLRTGFKKIQEKKWRSIFTNFVSSLSLLALGISIIVTTSLRNQIVSSFANLVNKNQIIVTKKSQNPNPYTSYVATEENVVQEIADEYSAYTYGMGTTYLTNFNIHFPDRNQVYILNQDNKIVLSSFQANKFNEYVWPEEKSIERFYPSISRELQLNEVILGLPYIDMINLCIRLNIDRSFEALGSFLLTHQVRLFLGIDNLSWQYDNDIELRLVSVYPATSPEVYHTNHLFNSYIFELEAHLPTTLDIEATPQEPWTLKKVFTLHLTESPAYLAESVQCNNKYDDILLENAQNFLNESCIADDTCARNVVFVFTIDKNAVDISDIIEFKKIAPRIDNYFLSTVSGYQMHSSGMIMGFANNIGFSFHEEKIIEVGDYFSKRIEGDMEEFPETAIGGITRFNKNGVLFSSDLSKVTTGELPQDYNEIVISRGLINYLGYTGNPLYEDLYYCVYSSTLDAVIINKFKVVGIVEEEKNYIYHYPLFSISFFRDKLGVSSFNLVPTSMILNFDGGTNIDLLINDFSTSFKEYNFSCPLKEIGATVDEVMNYVTSIALIFSAISLVISVLLLALISYLNTIESINDIKLLHHLGHSQKSIKEYIVSHSLVTGIITTFIAIFELLIFQIFLSLFLNSYFGVTSSIAINIIPFFAVMAFGLLLPIVISAIIANIFLKKRLIN